jgi:hypothetical protein
MKKSLKRKQISFCIQVQIDYIYKFGFCWILKFQAMQQAERKQTLQAGASHLGPDRDEVVT